MAEKKVETSLNNKQQIHPALKKYCMQQPGCYSAAEYGNCKQPVIFSSIFFILC